MKNSELNVLNGQPPAGSYIISTDPYVGCNCRRVEANSPDEAIHQAAGIEAGGESNWYIQAVPGSGRYAGCGADYCTCEGEVI